MSLSFHPSVQHEINEVLDYYAKRSEPAAVLGHRHRPCDGTVQEILCAVGNTVESMDLMVRMAK